MNVCVINKAIWQIIFVHVRLHEKYHSQKWLATRRRWKKKLTAHVEKKNRKKIAIESSHSWFRELRFFFQEVAIKKQKFSSENENKNDEEQQLLSSVLKCDETSFSTASN